MTVVDICTYVYIYIPLYIYMDMYIYSKYTYIYVYIQMSIYTKRIIYIYIPSFFLRGPAWLATMRCASVRQSSLTETKPRPTVPSFHESDVNVRGVRQLSTGHCAAFPPVTDGTTACGSSSGPKLSVSSMPKLRSSTCRTRLLYTLVDHSSTLALVCRHRREGLYSRLQVWSKFATKRSLIFPQSIW